MNLQIDRKLALSIRQQLKGAIEHGISFGDMPIGSPLPSVRDLAEQVGVAPMTVSKVYAELKDAGLIEARAGAGTYVADSSLARVTARANLGALRRDIDRVIDDALALGLPAGDIVALINARVTFRIGAGRRKSIVMIGLFPDATASYAAAVEHQVGAFASVRPGTIDMLTRDADFRARCAAADLILTFANLHDQIARLVPGVRVISTRFIPSEATRMALASLDPMATMAVVSRFPDFLPILSLGVRRFAAHVQSVVTLNLDDPALPQALANCSVVVISTGADAAAEAAPPDALKIEYRHIPDPGDIDRLVMPIVTNADATPDNRRKEAP